MMIIMLCPYCKAPTSVPDEIEKQVEELRSYQCWDCKKKVRINPDFKYFVKATKPFSDER
ncbi:hypothetical protein COJ96_10750 [Bacillus sp. AFS073361]|uniref:hypothetical protein n=1 Tax=Bacillus sp. AFS073361 TaxID=2033511 RepID=UPI000BFA5191|nr:hypothetical protein [Bacillus sp. AFS073361]PFP29375.1 hypothetical protein COJ96_10750 [Bacillus sp. AFS073361]